MTTDLDVVAAITGCGGISDAATLMRLTSRTPLENATIRGLIVKDARGRYALPTAPARCPSTRPWRSPTRRYGTAP